MGPCSDIFILLGTEACFVVAPSLALSTEESTSQPRDFRYFIQPPMFCVQHVGWNLNFLALWSLSSDKASSGQASLHGRSPLILTYNIITRLQTTVKLGAHSSDPLKEGKDSYHGPIGARLEICHGSRLDSRRGALAHWIGCALDLWTPRCPPSPC